MLRFIGFLVLFAGVALAPEALSQGNETTAADVGSPFSMNCLKPIKMEQFTACEQKRASDIAERAYAEQKRASDIAVQALVSSWWQAAIGLVGLVLVLASLRAARLSANAAMNSAEAALKGVKIQQEIGQAQVRAYISADEGRVTVYNGYIGLNIVVTNRGGSHASNLQVNTIIRVSPDHPCHRGLVMLGEERKQIGELVIGDIGAGASREATYAIRWSVIFHPREHLGELIQETIDLFDMRIFATVTISYTTVFGQAYEESFELMSWVGLKTQELWRIEDNKYKMIPRPNHGGGGYHMNIPRQGPEPE